MDDRSKKEIIEKKLDFSYDRLRENDENEPEDHECIAYIKEQIGYYKRNY